MTLPKSGDLSTTGIAEQLYNNSGATISTASPDVHRLVKKTSGISIPNDFYTKGWGQQMNDLAPNAYNQGNSGNMSPHLMDRRCDGGITFPAYTDVALTGAKGYYGGVLLRNDNRDPFPREIAFNGYYIVRNPNSTGQFNIGAEVQYENNYVSGSRDSKIKLNLIGFSSGYLSGNRNVFTTEERLDGSSGTISIRGYYASGFPHVCVNMAQWQGPSGHSYGYIWDGWAS